MAQSNITVTVATSNVAVSSDQTNVTVSSSLSNVVVSNTVVVTNSTIREALSGGYGIDYSNVSGVIQTANSDVRALVSGTSPITYNSGTGAIGIDSAAVFSGKTTDDLTQGSTNKYFTTSGATVNTTALPEGTNLYYTNARVNAYIVDNGLDFNAEKVDDRVADLMVAGANLTYTYDDTANSLTLTQQLKTQDITEGDNLYFTDTRVHTAIGEVTDNGTVSGNITLDLASNITHKANISGNITNISFTNAPANGYQATVILTQDSTGGHELQQTYFSNWEFTDNYKTFDDSPGDQNIVTVLNDGSTTYASVVGFKSGNFTTDSVPEGSTNFYFTDARANTAIGAYTGALTNLTGNITTGGIITAGTNATDTHTLTGNLTVTGNAEVTGNLNYRNVTDLYVTDQKITLNANATTDATVELISNRPESTYDAKLIWNEPSEVWQFMNGDNTSHNMLTSASARGLVSVTTASASGDGALAYNNSTGVFTFTPADSNAAPVDSVNGQTGVVVLETNDIAENTNLYYTDARFDTRLGTKSTTNLAEGTNLYYTDARADARVDAGFTAKSTSDLSEGTNLYFTGARARGNISVGTPASASGGGSLAYDSGTGVFTFAPADLSAKIELTNLSVTTATASGDGSLTYDNTSGVFTFTPADAGLSDYGDSNVVTLLNAFGSNTISSTANITTTANISGGNLLTDHVISASGQPLQLKGQTDGVKVDKTISSVESRIFDTDTTGYSVATADFGSANVTSDKVPSFVIQAAGTSGSNTLTATLLFGGAFGPIIAGRSNPTAASLYDFNIVNTGTGLGPAMQAPTDLDLNLAGWFVYDVASASTTSKLPVNAHVTGISGNTITLSENLTSDISYGGGGFSVVLFPGAYSSTQDIGFSIAGDDTSSVTYDYAISRYNGYNLPETLSNVTLDRVSYGDSTVDMANVVMRHVADVETGPDSAIRIPRAMLIGANATPDLLSIGTNTALPATSTLGLTIEQDGLTDYGATETTPQMKLMLNNYQTNSLASKTTYPTWSEFLGQSGNATVDMPYLGAPAFNFKHLGGSKSATAASSEGEIPGRITFNALTGTGTNGSDQVNPPASITTMVGGTGALTTMANLDMYFQSTSATAYRNGPYVGASQGDPSGGSIPQTFLASKSGSTVLASNQAGTISLRPARDYAQSGNASSYVDNRYADNLHDYHTFLEANWENPAGRTGSRVTINAKSGQTNGATPSGSDFNYDSKGDASLRFRTHNADSSVKASWDIEASQSSNNLAIIDSLNDGSPTTVIDISGNSVHVDRRLRLQNLTTTEINALGSPQTGDTVFNTTENTICFYNGSSWQKVSSSNL